MSRAGEIDGWEAAGMGRLLLQRCDAILGICTKMESSGSPRGVDIALGTLTFYQEII